MAFVWREIVLRGLSVCLSDWLAGSRPAFLLTSSTTVHSVLATEGPLDTPWVFVLIAYARRGSISFRASARQ